MKRALFALATGQFVVGTTSLGVIGLVEEMRADLGVSAAAIAGLVTVFALVYAVAAPGLQALIGHWPRRALVAGAMALAGASCLLCAVAPNYATVAVARIGMALGAALIGPTAAAAAAAMAPPEGRAGALAIVFGGLTVATVLGIPITAWLGQTAGWRAAWVAIGAAALICAPLVWLALPAGERGARMDPGALMAVLGARASALSLAATAILFAGGFATYALLAPWLTEAAGMSRAALPLALLAYGVLGIGGNVAAGPVARRLGPDGAVMLALGGVVAGALALWLAPLLAPGRIWAIWPGLAMLAWFWLMYMAPMQARLVELDPRRAPLALALNASALYVGMAAGSALSGVAHGALGAGPLPLISALGVALALPVFAAARGASRKGGA
jgi:DHA1 family inner membrane transport protein